MAAAPHISEMISREAVNELKEKDAWPAHI